MSRRPGSVAVDERRRQAVQHPEPAERRVRAVTDSAGHDHGRHDHSFDGLGQGCGQGCGQGEERLTTALVAERRAAEHQRLLIDELNHRVKNTLATVQSIATQTLRNAETTAQAYEGLETRLLALSRAHDVLIRESWEGADLVEVVAQAVAPYREAEGGRFRIAGPSVRITPRMSLALAMAFQELATNAVKYGALSTADGAIEIAWSVVNGVVPPRLSLHWSERGGPPVKAPKRRGFGSRLIERNLARDLDGRVEIAFAETGVVCTVDAPIT